MSKKKLKIKCICIQCDIVFYTNESQVGKFCSTACFYKSRKVDLISKTCLNCDEEFLAKNSDVKRGGGKYCSKTCNYSHKKERTFIDKKCLSCGEGFRAKRTEIKRGWGEHCSKKCSNKQRVNFSAGIYSESYFLRNPKSKNNRVILYLLEFNDNENLFQKIGITSRKLKDRWSSIKYNYTILDIKELPLYEAFQLEQNFIKNYNEHQYYPFVLSSNGATECFIDLPNNVNLDSKCG